MPALPILHHAAPDWGIPKMLALTRIWEPGAWLPLTV